MKFIKKLEFKINRRFNQSVEVKKLLQRRSRILKCSKKKIDLHATKDASLIEYDNNYDVDN